MSCRRIFAIVLTFSLCMCVYVFGKPGLAAKATSCPEESRDIADLSLFAPSLDRSKKLFIYLPSDYECAEDRRYPVFYFNDGHDLFDWAQPPAELEADFIAELSRRDAWYGSWQLARQLEQAAKTDRLPRMIVVGIASDDGFRSSDLAPSAWSGSAEIGGARYGEFIASIVVPTIDRRFRTLRDRRCRGIGGASLGGVSALQIGLGHRDLFGMVLSLSPVLGEPTFADHVSTALAAGHRAPPLALLLDFDDDPVGVADHAWFQALSDTRSAASLRSIVKRTPGGRHRIASWSKRVIPALVQLFDARCG
jgi:enterochelin esterase-like enzyme